MLCYETYQTDSTDPTYNPIWRQGSSVLPFTSRFAVTLHLDLRSLYISICGHFTSRFAVTLHIVPAASFHGFLHTPQTPP